MTAKLDGCRQTKLIFACFGGSDVEKPTPERVRLVTEAAIEKLK